MPKRPPIADLIAKTPGAQSREEARRRLAARRAKIQSPRTGSVENFSAPEPDPLASSQAFAKQFFERLMEKDTPPPRGMKPRLVKNNDETDSKKPKSD